MSNTEHIRLHQYRYTFNLARSKLILDIVADQKNNSAVLVASSSQIEKLSFILDQSHNMYAKITMETAVMTKNVAQELNLVQLKDNRKLLYMIILSHVEDTDDIAAVVKNIRDVDIKAQIIVIAGESMPRDLNFEDLGAYDIYLLVSVTQTKYIMYQTCRFCDEGKDKSVIGNTWSYKFGFKHNFQLTPSFTGSFFGGKVNMGIMYTNNFKPIGKNKMGKTLYGGQLYTGYAALGKLLNLTWNFQLASDGVKFKLVAANNSPVGLMKDLVSGTVDVVAGGWTSNTIRYQHSDFSTPENFGGGTNVISNKPLQGIQWYSAFQSFSWHTWALIVITTSFVGSILYLLRYFSLQSEKHPNFGDALWDATVVMCWDGISCKHPSIPICILLSVLMTASLILVSGYMGTLFSIVFTPRDLTPPIDSADQFWDTDLKWLGFGGIATRYIRYFSNIPEVKQRFVKVQVIEKESPYVTMMKRILGDPDSYVTFLSCRVATYIVNAHDLYKQDKKGIYCSKQKFGITTNICLLFPKGSPFIESFDVNILRIRETAMGVDLKSRSKHTVKRRIYYEKLRNKVQLVELRHFKGAFLLFLVGNLSAVVVYIYDIFCIKYIFKQKKQSWTCHSC